MPWRLSVRFHIVARRTCVNRIASRTILTRRIGVIVIRLSLVRWRGHSSLRLLTRDGFGTAILTLTACILTSGVFHSLWEEPRFHRTRIDRPLLRGRSGRSSVYVSICGCSGNPAWLSLCGRTCEHRHPLAILVFGALYLA
jgi:hypothetical protein